MVFERWETKFGMVVLHAVALTERPVVKFQEILTHYWCEEEKSWSAIPNTTTGVDIHIILRSSIY